MGLGLGLGTIAAVLSSHHFHQLPTNLLHTTLLTIAASTAFGLIGAALGFLGRSTAGAVFVFVGWVVFGELIILNTVAPHVEKWLPGLATSLTNPASHPAVHTPVAVGVLATYVDALLAAAAATLVARDIG